MSIITTNPTSCVKESPKQQEYENDVSGGGACTPFLSNLCQYGLCSNTKNSSDQFCFRCFEQWRRNGCKIPTHLEEQQKQCRICSECGKRGGPVEKNNGMCFSCARETSLDGQQVIEIEKLSLCSRYKLYSLFSRRNLDIPFSQWICDKDEIAKTIMLSQHINYRESQTDVCFNKHARRALCISHELWGRVPVAFNTPPCLGNNFDNINDFDNSVEAIDFYQSIGIDDSSTYYIRSDKPNTLFCDWLITKLINDECRRFFPIAVSFDQESSVVCKTSAFFSQRPCTQQLLHNNILLL